MVKKATLLIIALILLDQLSKFWARFYLKPLKNLDFIPRILEFRYAENTGVAFSYLSSHPVFLMILISLINVILLYLFLKEKETALFFILIFSGAISNLIDRYFFGFVTDFINPTFMNFAIFNLADVFLNLGLYLYIFELLFSKEKKHSP